MESEWLYAKERLAVERKAQPLKSLTGESAGAGWAQMRRRLARAERDARTARRLAIALFGASLAGMAAMVTVVLPRSAPLGGRWGAGEAPAWAGGAHDLLNVGTRPGLSSSSPDCTPSPPASLSDRPPPPEGSLTGVSHELVSSPITPSPALPAREASDAKQAGKPRVAEPPTQPGGGATSGPDIGPGGKRSAPAGVRPSVHGSEPASHSPTREGGAPASSGKQSPHVVSPHVPGRQPRLQPAENRHAASRSGRAPEQPGRGAHPAGARRRWVAIRFRRTPHAADYRGTGAPARGGWPSRYRWHSRRWRLVRINRPGSATFCLVDPQGHWWMARRVQPQAVRRGDEAR